MIDTREIDINAEASSFGRKKRNSVCLESKDPLITCANETLPRISSFYGITQGFTAKNRRFSDSKQGPKFDSSPLDALNFDFGESKVPINRVHVHGAKPRKTRRSSLTMPKTSWPELEKTTKTPSFNFTMPPVTFEDSGIADIHFHTNGFNLPNPYQQNFANIEQKHQDFGIYYLDDPNFMSNRGVGNGVKGNNAEQKCKLIRKGPWSKEEDTLLRKYASGLENRNWTEIAEQIPGRTAKQCRERWTFNLDPSINKDTWKLEEDLLLIQKQDDLGNKWAQIAQLLPGRTENAVKTRFKSILRAKKREWKPYEDMRLLELYQNEGANWERIASVLPSHRTKHAVKIRFKELQQGLDEVKPCEKGNARQTVRLMFYPKETLSQVSQYYKSLANGEVKIGQTEVVNSNFGYARESMKSEPIDGVLIDNAQREPEIERDNLGHCHFDELFSSPLPLYDESLNTFTENNILL